MGDPRGKEREEREATETEETEETDAHRETKKGRLND
jgi:hypothetical protein